MVASALQPRQSRDSVLSNRDADRRQRYDLIAEVARSVSQRREIEKFAELPELEPDNMQTESLSFSLELLD